MTLIKITAAVSFGLLAAAFTVPNARADAWDKLTYITTSQAMQVPGGIVLPAGKYTLRVLDSPSDRHIVQFMNDRQNHVFATVGAINNYRMEPSGKTAFTFYEMPAGQPEALRAWFYPGDNFGQEFVYPKGFFNQTQTAQTQTQTVAEAAPPAPAPTPEAPAAEPAPAPAPEPSPEVAQNEPAPAPAPAPEPTPRALPQTASDMPLFALLGFLSIGAAFSVRAFAKRTN